MKHLKQVIERRSGNGTVTVTIHKGATVKSPIYTLEIVEENYSDGKTMYNSKEFKMVFRKEELKDFRTAIEKALLFLE